MTEAIGMAAFAAALGCALVAGVFFAFSSFVMPALARLPAPHGMAAMQAINVAAITPAFMAALFGSGVLCLSLAIAALTRWQAPGTAWLLAGATLYLLGAIGVTMVCNVPRNNLLAALDPNAVNAAGIWSAFLRDWTAWNHLRGAAALAAAGCFIGALL